jgi:hypothetical protein
MKVLLTVQEILIWHDAPQLFIANDSIGGIYIALAIELNPEMPRFLVVAVSATRLRALKTGHIDLHDIFAKPELEAWFQIKSFEQTNLIAEQMPEYDKIPTDWLPTTGAFLHPQPNEAPLLSPESFAAVKVGAVAKEAGINASLLRQYVSGVKHPTIEQALRVQDALHRVAQRLLEVRLV